MTEVTPRTIAERFGIQEKRVRDHLRDLFGTLESQRSPRTRWILSPEEESTLVERLRGLGYEEGPPEVAQAGRPTPRPWTAPDVDDTVYEVQATDLMERTVTHAEFELQVAFQAWLANRGTPAAELPLPVGGIAVHPDFYVEVEGWIVEAKRSPSRQHVRLAIGQVLDYCHLADAAGLAVQPVILLPDRPTDDLVDLIASLGITLVHRSEVDFTFLGPRDDLSPNQRTQPHLLVDIETDYPSDT